MCALSQRPGAEFAEKLARFSAEAPPRKLAVAVSGGGDSMALLALATEWAKSRGVALFVVTVDHGLRTASAREARFVADFCAQHDLAHNILHWENRPTKGNLQAQARQARIDLISAWANAEGIAQILTGHTADDQAETILLRLGRGSGVDGLSGIAETRTTGALTWWRPLLSTSRKQLRDYLRSRNIPWIEDPSNDDPRFDRVKAREALRLLKPLGIDQAGLNTTGAHMRRAARALQIATQDLAAATTTLTPESALVIERKGFAAAPSELQTRLAASAIRFLSVADYKPRFSALRAGLASPKPTTLNGVRLLPSAKALKFTREAAAAQPQPYRPDMLWDNRWRILGPGNVSGAEIRPIDKATLQEIASTRAPRPDPAALLATPAIWHNGTLIAAPSAGIRNSWEIRLIWSLQDFISSILTH